MRPRSAERRHHLIDEIADDPHSDQHQDESTEARLGGRAAAARLSGGSSGARSRSRRAIDSRTGGLAGGRRRGGNDHRAPVHRGPKIQHRFVGLWQDQGRAAARAEPGIYFALGSADAAFHCCPSRSNRQRRPVRARAAECERSGPPRPTAGTWQMMINENVGQQGLWGMAPRVRCSR